MPSSPLVSTHGRTTSGVACHHRLWATQTVERCRVWHAIIALGQQTRSNDVRRDMPSPPMDNRRGQSTSGVPCHHLLWAAHTVKRRRPWHAIIAFGQHTWSNDVARGMPSSPLDGKHGRTTSAWHANIAFGQHRRSHDVGRGMPSSPLGSTHGRTTSGVACPWTANTVRRRQA